MKRHRAKCPVASLATEANELLYIGRMIEKREVNRRPAALDPLLKHTIEDRLKAIIEQASYTRARSHVGAAFQLMLAAGQADLADCSTDAEDEERRAQRLIAMAVHWLRANDAEVNSLRMVRDHYMLPDISGWVASSRHVARRVMHGSGPA